MLRRRNRTNPVIAHQGAPRPPPLKPEDREQRTEDREQRTENSKKDAASSLSSVHCPLSSVLCPLSSGPDFIDRMSATEAAEIVSEMEPSVCKHSPLLSQPPCACVRGLSTFGYTFAEFERIVRKAAALDPDEYAEPPCPPTSSTALTQDRREAVMTNRHAKVFGLYHPRDKIFSVPANLHLRPTDNRGAKNATSKRATVELEKEGASS